MKPSSTEWTSDSGAKPRILVVDDDPRLLAGLASLLKGRGYDVTEAEGGRMAYRILETHSFDLAMLDLRMPDVDGFDVMERLASEQPDCGVVVVSGESSFSSVSRALRRGALDYIRKPFDPEVLMELVDKALWMPHLVTAHTAAPVTGTKMTTSKMATT